MLRFGRAWSANFVRFQRLLPIAGAVAPALPEAASRSIATRFDGVSRQIRKSHRAGAMIFNLELFGPMPALVTLRPGTYRTGAAIPPTA